VVTDIKDRTAVDALFEAAVARFGRVDVVVHSAAVVSYGRFEDVPPMYSTR
jgi:NAD(P)-dependent dehydrogenase (short-subunit alcohol dehydrogenase family)